MFGYLGEAFEPSFSGGGPATELYGEHLIDLIALALGAEGEARELVEQRSVGHIRRTAILREIEKRVADRGLTANSIAGVMGITPRYVRLLLEPTGRSFSEHLLEKRLERAANLLRDPRQRSRRISAIAFECGFDDVSYFNRTFRKRYGATPTDMRNAALSSRGD